jgi:hypothetical protein
VKFVTSKLSTDEGGRIFAINASAITVCCSGTISCAALPDSTSRDISFIKDSRADDRYLLLTIFNIISLLKRFYNIII